MITKNQIGFLFILSFLIGSALSGCTSQDTTAAENDLLSQAAAEATAIVQEAQATALVLQAHTQATTLVAQANLSNPTIPPAPTLVALAATHQPQDIINEPTPGPLDGQPVVEQIKIIRVGFATDGALIIIQFIAPPDEAAKWWQGDVSVTEETRGTIYNEIPVLPKVGPMIGRPKLYGQVGYVMLVNAPPYLKSGALVTVRLGNYQFEHLLVE